MNRRDLEAKVEQLEAENAQLKEAALTASKESKGKQQAQAALALLQQGPVSISQLKEINPKYPSDPIFFVRTLLKQTVVTHRAKGGNTTYSLPGTQVVAQENQPEATPVVEVEVTGEDVSASEPVATSE